MNRQRILLALFLIYFVFAILLNSVGTVILQVINNYGVSKAFGGVVAVMTVPTPFFPWVTVGVLVLLVFFLVGEFLGEQDRWRWLAANGLYALAWAAGTVLTIVWMR